MACTMGLIAVAIVMVIMGFAGAPGAILFAAGQKAQNALLRMFGLILAALGQSYVVGAYVVFMAGLLRWFSTSSPDVPTWPLWAAVFFHSVAVPTYGTREMPSEPTAQHHTLGIVALVAIVIFIITALSPGVLKPIYGWVPLFNGNTIKSSTASNFPEQFLDDRTAFVQSITALRESSDLSQPSDSSGGSFTIPKEIERRIHSRIEEGIALSKRVNDAFLDYIHPDLKDYYRNKLIIGTQIYYDGIKESIRGNVSMAFKKQIEGNGLVNEWIVWWESHSKNLAKRVYPEN